MLDITRNERDILEALAARPALAVSPAQLIEQLPATFGKRSPQGLHQTAVSLVHKRLIGRGSDLDGHTVYQIRPEAIPELAADRGSAGRIAALTALLGAPEPGSPDDPDFMSFTITVKMTAGQRRGYATEYTLGAGPEADAAVRADVRAHAQEEIGAALNGSYWLREFASYSVSDPQ